MCVPPPGPRRGPMREEDNERLDLWGEHRLILTAVIWGFPHSSVGKESTCNAGDLGSIPGLGRSPGEGNANPLQYSCLENLMDRGVHGVAKESDTT